MKENGLTQASGHQTGIERTGAHAPDSWYPLELDRIVSIGDKLQMRRLRWQSSRLELDQVTELSYATTVGCLQPQLVNGIRLEHVQKVIAHIVANILLAHVDDCVASTCDATIARILAKVQVVVDDGASVGVRLLPDKSHRVRFDLFQFDRANERWHRGWRHTFAYRAEWTRAVRVDCLNTEHVASGWLNHASFQLVLELWTHVELGELRRSILAEQSKHYFILKDII